MKKLLLLGAFSILFFIIGQSIFAALPSSEIELMDRKDVIDYVLYTIVFAVAVATSLIVLWFLFRRKSKK